MRETSSHNNSDVGCILHYFDSFAGLLMLLVYLILTNNTCIPSQVSNEIIKRCSTKISLDDIFEGRIKTSMQGLQESIECCESWKHTYSKVKLLSVV